MLLQRWVCWTCWTCLLNMYGFFQDIHPGVKVLGHKVHRQRKLFSNSGCPILHFFMSHGFINSDIRRLNSSPIGAVQYFPHSTNEAASASWAFTSLCACACACVLLSRVWLSVTLWAVAQQSPLPREFSRQEHWRSLSLLQGIFPTQGSNPGLLHHRQILYQLSTREAQEYRSRYPIRRGDLPDPGIELASPALQADPLLADLPRKPFLLWNKYLFTGSFFS